jgi:hypothetical protein
MQWENVTRFTGTHASRLYWKTERNKKKCDTYIYRVCQNISGSLDVSARLDSDNNIFFRKILMYSLMTGCSKQIAPWGVGSRLVVWIREFMLGRSLRDRIGRRCSEEFRVTSRVQQGCVQSPLLFLPYVNDIWWSTESKIRFFADNYIIYRKILTLILLTSTKWWACASARKWRMGFNSAFKGLTFKGR